MISKEQNDLNALTRQIIKNKLNQYTRFRFKPDIGLSLYYDLAGQRDNFIVVSFSNRDEHLNLLVKRYNTFENEGDIGTEGAILLEVTISKCKVIAIKENSIEFDTFVIDFSQVHSRRMSFDYEGYVKDPSVTNLPPLIT